MSIRDKMTELANYIRDKSDTNEQLTIDDMIEVMPEIGSIYDKQLHTNILNNKFPIKLVIPEGVETICVDIFSDTGGIVGYKYKNSIHKIKFPKSLRYIGNGCFCSLPNLTEIEFQEDSIVEIGDNCFNSLANLTSLNLPNSLQKIGKDSFKQLSKITNLELPDSIQSIGNYAFHACGNLTHLELPANLDIINENAFSNLSALQYLKVGENVNNLTLCNNAFNNCSRLNYIENYPKNSAIIYNGDCNTNSVFRFMCAYVKNNSVKNKNGYEISFNTNLITMPANNNNIETLTIPNGVINISSFGDAGCKEIIMPNSVKSIAPYAFANASTLTSITIPKSVIGIGASAFRGASKLENIIFENGINLSRIEPYTFYGCAALTSITIPEGVTSIGDHAFQGCAVTTLTIPSTVTNIDKYAFSSCGNLTSVTIPEGITSIEPYTFENCGNLTSINIPEGVISIGYQAFYQCTRLTSITIPSTVITIDSFAFYYCYDLTEIIFTDPNNIPNIKSNAFYSCPKLSSTNIPENCNASIASDAFVYCNKSLVIPTIENPEEKYEDEMHLNHIDYLSTNSFSFTNKKDNIYLESVYYLHKKAFYFSNIDICNTFTMPKNIKYIEDGILYASNGSSINIEHLIIRSNIKNAINILCYNDNNYTNNGVKRITYTDDVTSISQFATYNNKSLLEVNISSTVTSIEDYAFQGCSNLTSINFTNNSNVKSIGSYAFTNCESLTNVTIPEGVTNIGEHTFDGCIALTSITIPEGVTSIGDHAFQGCSALTSIVIPSTVTSIGDYAFANCSALTSITIPEGVTEIGDNTFANCGLTTLNIPSTVTSISKYAFAGCNKLTSITIPEGVTNIDEGAFTGCSSLTSIIIPSTVISIGDYAFQGCSALTSITIPEGVTSIGNYIFNACTSLTSVTIPEGVTSIGDRAFSTCTSLTSVTIPEGVTSIESYAFSTCISLTSITIPEGVTEIGDNAFTGCIALNNVTLSNNVINIGYSAFAGCNKLTNITLSNNLNIIGKYAFQNCDLSEINIPNSVTKIYNDAFYNNNNVTKITVPNTFTPYYNSICLSSFTNTDLVINASSCDFTNIFNEFKPYINNSGKFKSITVIFDENVESIGSGIFNDFVNMTNNFIIKSDYITTIEDHAFDGCNFTNFDMQIYTITSIGDYAFANCGTYYSTINLYSDIDFNNVGEYIYDNTNISTINVPYSWINTPEETIKDALFNNNSCKSYVTINYTDFNENGEMVRARLLNKLELNDNLSNYNKVEFPVVLRWDGTTGVSNTIDYSEDESIKPGFSTDNQIELILDTPSDIINDSNLHTFYFTPENNGIYQIINELGDYVSPVSIIDDENKKYIGAFNVYTIADSTYIELYAGKTYIITASSSNEYSITIKQYAGEITSFYTTGMNGGALMSAFSTFGPIMINPDKSPNTKIKVTINNNEYEFYNMYTAASAGPTTYYIGSMKNTFPITNTETGAVVNNLVPDENENEIVNFCIFRPWGAVFASKNNMVENDSLLLSIDLIM